MKNELLYFIPKESHCPKSLSNIIENHPEIKFVSLIGVDLSGNDTDERIPVKVFLEDMDNFLYGHAAQTDGSSVALPGIASLNNAKVDMISDLDCNWFIDYNYENIDAITGNPIGTIRIPCFLKHCNKFVDSRKILKNSIDYFKSSLLELLAKHPESLTSFGITVDDISEIVATSATELEFWVKTPNDKAETEELSTSQTLQEQYWKKTTGCVRTAMEQTLMIMENYGLEPEMGHKEVGGIKAKLTETGSLNHIMEQLEIDWKYSTAIQAADNELWVRDLVQETFRRNGLEVTLNAKPIDGVAGNGKHIHIGVALKLKDGRRINLFAGKEDQFLSGIGYGAIMGVLKNYEIMNPFISSTNDSLRRLKPGFEAPICIVTSLGRSVEVPSRNRTVLVGVVRDNDNPLATRFELRSPNPYTNTYLAMAVTYMAMCDGIRYALESNLSDEELLAELSKKPGETSNYLEKERAYRSEEDVFDDYTEEERTKFFGKAPATVHENFSAFTKYKEKLSVLTANDVFTDAVINSFRLSSTNKWATEIKNRILSNYMDEIRSYKMLHQYDKALDLDVKNWMIINDLRYYLMKDSYTSKSLFTRIKTAIAEKDYDTVSNLQIELDEKMTRLRSMYAEYQKNLLDI